MSNEQLNNLLQQWAAVRIKSSSKATRAKRLRDILDGISKKEPRKNAKPGSASERLEEPYSGPMRKKPRSVTLSSADDSDEPYQRGKLA